MRHQNRWTLVLGVFIAVILIVGAGSMSSFAVPEAMAQTPANETRTITVIGEGMATAQPDRVTVRVGVETEDQSPGEALAQNNKRIEALQAKLAELGIGEDAIETSNFSISPGYRGPDQEPNKYVVRNTLKVQIDDLSRVGEILDQLVQAGANRIYGLNYQVKNAEPLHQQARADAIQQARQQAEQYAAAINASLGPVLAINENISRGVQPIAEAAGRSAVPIEPGEQRVTANVEVTFELLEGNAASR